MSEEDQNHGGEPIASLDVQRSTPQMVTDNFEFLRRSVLAGMGLQAFDAEVANRIMKAIMDGRLELWVFFIEEAGVKYPVGTITFKQGIDDVFRFPYLYIYSFHCARETSSEAWIAAFAPVLSYAKERKCDRIYARTSLPRVADIAISVGFEVSVYLERKV